VLRSIICAVGISCLLLPSLQQRNHVSTLLNIVSVNDHIPQVVVCLVLIDYYLEFDVAIVRKPLCEVQFLLFAFLDLENSGERRWMESEPVLLL
jgi:hypothetical protein